MCVCVCVCVCACHVCVWGGGEGGEGLSVVVGQSRKLRPLNSVCLVLGGFKERVDGRVRHTTNDLIELRSQWAVSIFSS